MSTEGTLPMHEEGQGPNKDGAALGVSSQLSTEEETFLKLMKSAEVNSQELSEMASGRDGYAMAFLCLSSVQKGTLRGVPLRRLDLSDCTLSPRRIFFLLDLLPESIEEMKLGPAAVRGAACPLLCQFLGRVGQSASQQGGGGGPRLKSLSFARNSLGPSEAPLVFGVLPRGLETLSLEGNSLGMAGTQAFAEAVREGRVSSVRVLNLSETSLNDGNMEILSAAFAAAKPLKVESLLLGSNRFFGKATLSPLLRKETFPFLKNLQLARCRLSHDSLTGLADKMKEGELLSLESLGLDRVQGLQFPGNEDLLIAAVAFAEGLRGALVPSLKTLSMRGVYFVGAAADAVVSALASDEAPPLETVDLDVSLCEDQSTASTASAETARVLCSGELRCLRSVGVEIDRLHGAVFIQGVIDAPEPPPWRDLSLFVDLKSCQMEEASQIQEALADAFRVERLSVLRKFDLSGGGDKVTRESMESLFLRGAGETESGLPFLESLNLSCTLAGDGIEYLGGIIRSGKMSSLVELDLSMSELNVEGMGFFGELVRGGYLSKLQTLRLSDNGFGAEDMNAFFGGVCNSEQGLPALKILDLLGSWGSTWRAFQEPSGRGSWGA
uniref:Uncharacterized protein n=1 Tax=Chromera velia CCMP2878 TaxID=1169474 RepID=A0A0G4F9S9_9ALVE|eukprot:Cvel_15918.t1-p1 / transcript=Cvel_15918.t1 / gene=Cvel_15918 / organism=Chromera_velia_CCMP2878 / gene_product=hypothetical protein / transcript_product=hypothetical protein / location=Cvel_scaffold1203:37915-42062(+) / protein_length=610 / sequence_SO=supercontig / SO=protein_coding / is_pseudo=false